MFYFRLQIRQCIKFNIPYFKVMIIIREVLVLNLSVKISFTYDTSNLF